MQLMTMQFPKGLGKIYGGQPLPVTEFIANYTTHKAIQEMDNDNHAYFVQGGRVIGDLYMYDIHPAMYEAMNRPGVHVLAVGRATNIIAGLWFAERTHALRAMRDPAVNTENPVKIRISFQLDPRAEILDGLLTYLERRGIDGYSMPKDTAMEQTMVSLFVNRASQHHAGGIYTSESHDMWDCVIEFTSVGDARKFLARMPQVMEQLIK